MGKWIPIFMVMLAAFCWGTGGVFTKTIVPFGFSSADMVFIKSAVALFFLVLVNIRKGTKLFRINKLADLKYLTIVSLLGYVFYGAMFVLTVNEMGVGIGGAMLYTKCAFVIILERWIFQKKITAKKIFTVLLTITGCMGIAGLFSGAFEQITAKGLLFGFLSGVGFAIYDVMSKKVLDKNTSETVTFYTFFIASIVVGFIVHPLEILQVIMQNDLLPIVILYGIVVSGLPYILYVWALSKIDAGIAAIVSTFELFTAVFAGRILYHEPLNIITICSMIAILVAVLISNYTCQEIRNG